MPIKNLKEKTIQQLYDLGCGAAMVGDNDLNSACRNEIISRTNRFIDRIPVCRKCATCHDPGTDCPSQEIIAMVYPMMQNENEELKKKVASLEQQVCDFQEA